MALILAAAAAAESVGLESRGGLFWEVTVGVKASSDAVTSHFERRFFFGGPSSIQTLWQEQANVTFPEKSNEMCFN